MRLRRPAMIALAPLAVSMGLLGCQESSNSYAVAGAFVAAAAAAQVFQSQAAKAAAASGGSCELATCQGCCDAHGHCWSGGGDSTCGAGGGACEDCTQEDSVCASGGCYSRGDQQGGAPASPPVYWGAPTCNADACPACPLGSRCCSPGGGCSCTIGNLCP